MKRAVLRLTMKTFVSWLNLQLPPAGQPHTHDLEARWTMLIDSLVSNEGLPELGEIDKLDDAHMRAAMEWLFTALGRAYITESWTGIAVHCLRLLAMRNIAEMLAMIENPPKQPDPLLPRPVH
jgi:hypothetical protein